VVPTLTKDETDMNVPPVMPIEAKTTELLQIFDDNAAAVQSAIAATDEAALLRTWTLRQGEKSSSSSRESPFSAFGASIT
jgi:hypothetical protein